MTNEQRLAEYERLATLNQTAADVYHHVHGAAISVARRKRDAIVDAQASRTQALISTLERAIERGETKERIQNTWQKLMGTG